MAVCTYYYEVLLSIIIKAIALTSIWNCSSYGQIQFTENDVAGEECIKKLKGLSAVNACLKSVSACLLNFVTVQQCLELPFS